MRSPLRSPAQVEGPQGVLPQPEKDLERPSSTRLEARFPYCREPAYCILSAYCINPEADSARTVCIPFQNPFKMWRIDPDGFMQPLIPDVEMVTPKGDGAHAGAP